MKAFAATVTVLDPRIGSGRTICVSDGTWTVHAVSVFDPRKCIEDRAADEQQPWWKRLLG